MKNRFFIFGTMFLMFGFLLLLNNCGRDNADTETNSAKDNALAEQTFTDVKSITDQAAEGGLQTFIPNLNDGILGSCASITHDTTVNPRKLTIDFGTTNCTCNDGKERRGKILVSYTGRYRSTGTVINITFDNYYVNDNQVSNSSSKTITNNGRNSSNHLTYTIQVTGTIIKANNGGTISWTSTRSNEWIAGEGTPARNDDEYKITGYANGTTASGITFTIAIIKPLYVKLSCKHIVEGTVDIIPSGKLKRTLDYGSGNCDDQATVTINGRVFTITL